MSKSTEREVIITIGTEGDVTHSTLEPTPRPFRT